MMRPRAVGAVAEGHEQSEEHVEGDGADGREADVGRKVQDGEAHWQHELETLSFAQVHQFDVRVGHFVYKNVNSAAIEGLAVQSSAAQLAPQKAARTDGRSEEHTSELQSRLHLVCRLLLEKKKNTTLAST